MNPSNKTTRTDWHPADIKAALAKAGSGYTFARIAREYGYVSNAPNSVLHKPWSHMERIVAAIIGVRPADIWPSRYDRRGRPLKSGPQWLRTKNHTIAMPLSVAIGIAVGAGLISPDIVRYLPDVAINDVALSQPVIEHQ